MAKGKNNISKLERLTILKAALDDCCREYVKDGEKWQTFRNMSDKVKEMLTDERRKQGWMAVYPIVDGCAQESLFEGTKEQCQIYVDILKEKDPKTDIIVLQL